MKNEFVFWPVFGGRVTESIRENSEQPIAKAQQMDLLWYLHLCMGNTSVLHLLLQTVLPVKHQFVQINLLCKNCLRQPALVYQVGELAPQEPRTWRWPETRRADAAVHEGQIGKCATHLPLKKLPPLTGSNSWKKSGKIKHGGFSILDYHPNFAIRFFL